MTIPEIENDTVVMFKGITDQDEAYEILIDINKEIIYPGSLHLLETYDENLIKLKDINLILPTRYFESLGEL